MRFLFARGSSSRQRGAHAVDDVLHGERREQHAEQARSTILPVTPSHLAMRAASAKTTKQSASTATMTASRIREPHGIADRCGRRAAPSR